MADTTANSADATTGQGKTDEPTRRDFLLIATGTFAAVGVAAVAWPFIDQMNPDASALALAEIEVDVSSMEPGQSITVKWRGKPVFIRYRTEEEVAEAKSVDVNDLPDRLARNPNLDEAALATDENRTAAAPTDTAAAAQAAAETPTAFGEQWIVMVGICTHLGCVPVGEQGDFGGWFCPCHGSHYDTAGRIRRGPAPENLTIPPFAFVSDTTIRLG